MLVRGSITATLGFLLLVTALGSAQDQTVVGGTIRPDARASPERLEQLKAMGVVFDYDQPPKPIKITRPQYPKDALEKHFEGTVVLEIVIDSKGRVSEARVVTSIAGLDEAAIDCVKQWEFKPAVKKGHQVATIARAPITFRAPDAPSGMTQRLGPLSFDPQGADFTAWLDHYRITIYDNWIIPRPAELGYHGHVTFEFVVERDGSMSSVRMLSSSGVPAFDRAARNALMASKFLALPSDYGPPRVTMGVVFSYNEAQPGKSSPSPSPAEKLSEPAGAAPSVSPSPEGP